MKKEHYFFMNLWYDIITRKGMMKLKKKTLACAALLSGAIVGFVGVTAIDFACHKSTPLNHII